MSSISHSADSTFALMPKSVSSGVVIHPKIRSWPVLRQTKPNLSTLVNLGFAGVYCCRFRVYWSLRLKEMSRELRRLRFGELWWRFVFFKLKRFQGISYDFSKGKKFSSQETKFLSKEQGEDYILSMTLKKNSLSFGCVSKSATFSLGTHLASGFSGSTGFRASWFV